MNKCIFFIGVFFSGCPMLSFADGSVTYGYDQSNNLIYAKKDGRENVLKFNEDYTGNPSYLFDFFSGSPAIVVDSRSLHDSTVYATLKYDGSKFLIDCLYLNVKNKKNGILVKEGECKLDMSPVEGYADFIEKKVGKTKYDMDSIDTNLILNGKKSYLPIVIYNSKDELVYQFYGNKQALLDDNYSVISLSENGRCKVFVNSPWIIYNKNDSGRVEIMSEKISDGKIELIKSVPNIEDSNKCSVYPAISVIKPKSYFYDSSFKIKKSYLVKGDKVNLLSISADGKWCNARYINIKNIASDNIMLCADLSI
ncbi:TPA: hypothetical protein M2P66_002012 [Klebsiella quasipneumoniae]|uniref:hypothetical protein n=1 Tax=Klebsiella quasipneumoniae TaxID=1463165 RepID=UPI002368F83D|nr:hypothetical protein [Klebsiella quasipneumoniae]